MKYIKTRDTISHVQEDTLRIDLRRRMRKGLSPQHKGTGRITEDQEAPQQYADDKINASEEYIADTVYRNTDRTVDLIRDKRKSVRESNRKVIHSNSTTGAADNSAAPSFGVHITPNRGEKAGLVSMPDSNRLTTCGIPSGDQLPACSISTAQSRRTFIQNRQTVMFNQQSGTKSLSNHYSANTWRNKMAYRARESVRSAVRAIETSAKNLYVLLAGGSVVPVIVIILICSIGIAVGSVFGIFFSGQNSGSGKTMQDMVQEMNMEYQDKIAEVKSSVDYDYLDLKGSSAVWREILAVYAVRGTAGSDAFDVASLDESRIALLKEIFWDMNLISSYTEIITETVETETEDDEGNTVINTEEVEKTVLKIRVNHKTAGDMAVEYGFDEEQRLNLSELLSEENNALWAAVLYGLYEGDDYLIESAAVSRVGNFNTEVYLKGPMVWPLDSRYHTITDSFGFRIHPIKKAGHYHTGTDIGAPEGARIYAVLSGTVTAAGDAGTYGYRVIIDHGDGISTVYAHASKLLVAVGDTVEQGDTIALVGETGSATGPHLHIEVRVNNVSQDATNYLVLPD